MASSAASVALVTLLVAGCAAEAVSATSFTVGDTQGWSTGVDYTNWASGKTFAAGDSLVFNYTSKEHTVTEVSESDYNSCAAGNPVSNDDSGTTTVSLTTPGTHYFICTIPGHCSAGMKLAVTVSGPGSGGPGSAGPGLPTTPAGTVPGAAARLPASSVVAAAAGVLVKLALF